MAIIWNMTTPSVSKTVEQKELLCIAGGNAEWYSYFEKTIIIYPVFLLIYIL